jgi:hypothetical protein
MELTKKYLLNLYGKCFIVIGRMDMSLFLTRRKPTSKSFHLGERLYVDFSLLQQFQQRVDDRIGSVRRQVMAGTLNYSARY